MSFIGRFIVFFIAKSLVVSTSVLLAAAAMFSQACRQDVLLDMRIVAIVYFLRTPPPRQRSLYDNVFANLDFEPSVVSLTRVAVVSPTPTATTHVERAADVLFLRSRLLVTEPIGLLLLVSVVPVVQSDNSQPRTLTYLRDCSSSDVRDSSSSDNYLVIASLNVRSLGVKVDDVLEVRRDRSIDILCLVERWHDTEAVCFRRLRSDGFKVTDRPRPRPRSAGKSSSLSTNHRDVAVVAVPGVHLSPFNAVSNPT